MTEVFKYAYSLITPEEQRPKEWYEELEERVCSLCPSLTFEQRVTGCLMCVVLSFLISMGSTVRLVSLLKGDPEPFATMYTIGNVLGIASTCFLFGPLTQFKKMFAPTRLAATLVYIICIILTFLIVFYFPDFPFKILVIIFLVFFQSLALVWYSISYIPFARDFAKSCCKEVCCKRLGLTVEEEFWSIEL